MSDKQRREAGGEYASARQRAETHTTGFSKTHLRLPKGAELLVVDKAGSRKIDILPYRTGVGNPHAAKGQLYFERTYYTHRAIGVNQDQVVCPAKTLGKPCPICEDRNRMQKDPDADADTIKALNIKERQLFNVIDLEAQDKGVQIFDMSFFLFGQKLDDEVKDSDEDQGFEYFYYLEGGMSLKVGFKSKSMGAGKPFLEAGTIHFRARGPYGKDVLEKVHCLDDIPVVLEYDRLRAMYLQVDADNPTQPGQGQATKPVGDDDGWSDAKPVGRAAAPATAATTQAQSVVDNDDWGIASPAVPTAAQEPQRTELQLPANVTSTLGGVEIVCPACEGTGKNSRGNPCKPCKGLGKMVGKPVNAAIVQAAPVTQAPITATATVVTAPAQTAVGGDNWDDWPDEAAPGVGANAAPAQAAATAGDDGW